MQFEWPTPDQMIYRITRLRRLVVAAASLPVAVLLLGALLDPTFMTIDRATLAAAAVVGLLMGHVALFPNASVETLSLSISVTGLAVAAPWIKVISAMAPEENQTMVLCILIVMSVLAVGALMLLLQLVFGLLLVAGPVAQKRLVSAMDVGCSCSVARNQFVLQPGVRRGRILTGPADDNGFFEVAIQAPQVADPQDPTQPYIVRVAAKSLSSSDDVDQTMLVMQNGAVTVTAEKFTPTETGCRVEITELPGDFTWGMHAMFWLTDQQMDNLTETSDIIMGVPPRANGLAHGVSLLSVAGGVLFPPQQVADRAD